MATIEQILELRRKISEPDEASYTDVYLGLLIDAQPDVNLVAATIWEEKSSAYAEMVDITEAGSSRKNSQLSLNARAQADYFRTLASDSGTVAAAEGTSTTRRIVRL